MRPVPIQAELVVGGRVAGEVLRLDQPVSLWGGFDPATGELVDSRHPQSGCRLTGQVVLMRSGRGSSSSSSVVLESVRRGTAPAAFVLEVCDPILTAGAAAAVELYGRAPTIARVDRLPDLASGTPASLQGPPAPDRGRSHRYP